MVKKRILSIINEHISLYKLGTYEKIASKLHFDNLHCENNKKAKPKKSLRILIPATAACATVLIASIGITFALKSHSSTQPNHIVMKPISNDILSFYLNNSSFGSSDIPQETSVGGIYNTYKQKPAQMVDLAQKKEVFSLSAESSLRCYYVTKEVHEAVKQQLFLEPNDFMLPWRGLTAYCYGYSYGSWPDDLKNAQLMEAVIDVSTNQIDNNINDYYLLDIVRYYNDSSIESFTFVDFVSYSADDNKVLINLNDSKDSYKYCSCIFSKPNNIQKRTDYAYVDILDYNSFEITEENGVEIVEEMFGYIKRDDPYYYDEIDNCIIKKTFIESSANCDFYKVTFDYEKLVKLFGF